MDDLNSIIEKAKIAIDEIESLDAKELLNKLEKFAAERNFEKTDPSLYQKLKDLRIRLQLVAFPSLSDKEAADVLRHHYLDSFDSEILMEDKIAAKLFLVPYLERDDLRKMFQTAVLENSEKIGPLTIGQWIQRYEKIYDVRTRDFSAPVRFIIDNPQARLLSESDKKRLKKIIYIYDYLLISTLPATGPVLSHMLEVMPDLKLKPKPETEQRPIIASPYKQERETYTPSADVARKRSYFVPSAPASSAELMKMPIEEALRKFKNLGEQVISSNPIKLKIFPQLVRPSIKNWITDYHQALGQDRHGVIERGNYLYHSENARRLMQGERARLAVILKSLEEKTPLTVNAGAQQIVFGMEVAEADQGAESGEQDTVKRFREAMSEMSPQETYPPLRSLAPEKAPEEKPAPPPPLPPREKPVHFTSPQKFSSDADSVTAGSLRRPVAEKRDPFDPYRIEPIGYPYDSESESPKQEQPSKETEKKPEPRVEGNVVDLSNKGSES